MNEPAYHLSPREAECLRHVARGLQTKEIAAELRLAPNTVDEYLKSAMRKLGVRDRRVAARILSNQALPQRPVPQSQTLAETDASEVSNPPTRMDARPWYRVPLLRNGRGLYDLHPRQTLIGILILAAILAVTYANSLSAYAVMRRLFL